MKHYFQKYGIAYMIGLVIFVLILPVQVFAAGEDSSSETAGQKIYDRNGSGKNAGGNRAEIWELTEVKDLDTAIRKLFPEENCIFRILLSL